MNNIKIEITVSDSSYLIDCINLVVKTKIPSENREEMIKEIKELFDEAMRKTISII